MSETCPKCGADEKITMISDFDCGALVGVGGELIEGEGCLRRQLAAAVKERDSLTAERDALKAKLDAAARLAEQSREAADAILNDAREAGKD